MCYVFRKSRLLSNQATHYWQYQLRDDVCDCEPDEEEFDEGPVPPHKKSRLLSNQATHYWQYQLRDDVCDCEPDEEEFDEGPVPPHKYD
ncbi:hypothetical protein J6590_057512 [Homalodisca vitripennis]|nr:hypothetical protein J6590_057512 [Homalodisca vitripennis]